MNWTQTSDSTLLTLMVGVWMLAVIVPLLALLAVLVAAVRFRRGVAPWRYRGSHRLPRRGRPRQWVGPEAPTAAIPLTVVPRAVARASTIEFEQAWSNAVIDRAWSAEELAT